MTEREDRREASMWMGWYWSQIIVGVIVVVLIGVAIWVASVATSAPKGVGDAYQQKNSAENWTKQQAEFNRRYQSIKAMDRNITVAATALERDPDNTKRQVEYDGLVRACNDAVGAYDSLAREYLAERFRDSDLPSQINTNDPATNCKEN